MLTATVYRHSRVYTCIYCIYLLMYIVFYMYVSMSYIVCISDVYCMYLHVYTYFKVFSERKVVRRIDTVIYIQYTCIRLIYIQYTDSYTCIYVKIHTIYVHFFWEPVPNHHFSPCTYMDVYAVYSRIKTDIRTSKIYTYGVGICMYMHVSACICMYIAASTSDHCTICL
jgi:hypothetical protein